MTSADLPRGGQCGDLPPRRIRSFVRREGRITPAQQRNLELLWSRYGLDSAQGPCDWRALFGRDAPRTLEIGFGAGETLITLAAANPQQDFLGVEVYRSGVGQVLGALEQRGITNVRLFCEDAVQVLAQAIPSGSLNTLLLYFPDPWPKKRHHKRRLVQPEFADLVANCLAPGGIWRLATDWANYADWMRAVLDPHPAFTDDAGDADGFSTATTRPGSRFEARGKSRGHAIFDLGYRRLAPEGAVSTE